MYKKNNIEVAAAKTEKKTSFDHGLIWFICLTVCKHLMGYLKPKLDSLANFHHHFVGGA